mmetsp:Transcript_132903/g.230947  ORF Transcript_132903/g.230947 Transcript_132903/m.230947 type:complete len:92 (+) Transcript_132903:85-360(+)
MPTVTVKNSAGEVLLAPVSIEADKTLEEVAAMITAAPEGHAWSLFMGDVKCSMTSKLSDLTDGDIELKGSYSAIGDKAPPLHDHHAPPADA